MEIITRNDIRILRPDEYHSLREGSKKLSNQIWLDAMLLTGMRYEELRRLQQYPSWFKGGYIDMPKGNGNKTKKYARQRERAIHLSTMGKVILPIFLQGKVLPSRQSMDINLKRWAWNAPMNDTDISVKTFRKTWESWMVSSYPVVTFTFQFIIVMVNSFSDFDYPTYFQSPATRISGDLNTEYI